MPKRTLQLRLFGVFLPKILSHIPLLQVEKPFDTPAARATQGERTLTRLVSFKKSVRAEPVEA